VADGVYVRAHAVKQQMHGDFGGKLAFAGKLASFEIRDHEVLRLEHPFIHTSGSCQDAVVVEADGDIAFAGYDEASVVHPLSRGADVAAVLVFAFFVGGPERIRVHGAHFSLARRTIQAIHCPPAE